MALETLLIKVKTAISSSFDVVRSHPPAKPPGAKKRSNVGVLAFEIAGLMSKLVQLWQFLSDKNMVRLRNDMIALEGVRKIISNDEAFLLGLACAEIVETLRLFAASVARITAKCDDPTLRSFDRFFHEFADSGRDAQGWALSWKDMEAKQKKMDRFVAATATLYREIDELSAMENSLRKALQQNDVAQNNHDNNSSKIVDLQQKILWQRQEVKYLRERSLWNRTFDTVSSLLVRSIFTILARTKLVFGLGGSQNAFSYSPPPNSLPRSLSASSATVHPSELNHAVDACHFVSGPLSSSFKDITNTTLALNNCNFFEMNSKMLKPPPATTLGAAALAVHYANLIMVMEKMIKSPQLVGADARDDLYAMLPSSVRGALRARLRGVGFSASDPSLAAEWRAALGRILAWLSPLAHNMIKWQNDRSLEQPNGGGGGSAAASMAAGRTNVLLLQTLFFANKDKTEAAITELLVGLNYIWRFEREMTAKALFECNNIGLMSLQSGIIDQSS